MARNVRHHLPEGQYDDESPASLRHITKAEFARILVGLMTNRGWNQAETARRAGLTRDAVSTYARGRSFPEPANLKKLADAFGIPASQLLPNSAENAIDNDLPSFEMREATGHEGRVWLRLNRMVSFRQALAIGAILDGTVQDSEVAVLVKRIQLAAREQQVDLDLEGK